MLIKNFLSLVLRGQITYLKPDPISKHSLENSSLFNVSWPVWIVCIIWLTKVWGYEAR